MNYDFLTRLQNGESIQDIANDVTKSLNEANKQHIQEEKERIENEKRRAESIEQDKRYYAETLVDDLYNLLELYGVELNIDEEDDSVDAVLRAMDAWAPIFKALVNLKPSSTTIPEVETKEEDPISNFLRLFVDKA